MTDDLLPVSVSESVNGATPDHDRSHSQGHANAETMRQEQLDDETLRGWWSLAKRGKGGFFMKDGLLYHTERILGQSFSQLCLPKSRRTQVLELGHDTFGGHLAEKRTRERIRLSFTWPTLTSDCKRYCQTCMACQKRARKNIPRQNSYTAHTEIGGTILTLVDGLSRTNI